MSNSNINQHHPYLAKLRSWRAPIFNFSLLCSLGIVTYAFNWTTYRQPPKAMELIDIPIDNEIEVIRTSQQEKRTPPPPVIKPSNEIIPDDIQYNPEPEPEPIDDKIIVDDPEPVEPVIRANIPKDIPKIAPERENGPEKEVPFIIVEDMPRFKGCEDITENKKKRSECATGKLLEYIYGNIKYPPIARQNGIDGTVVIQFTIEKNGSITDVHILKDIGGGCGTEAARVVKGMPDWIPGKQRGREVRVRYNLPVRYKLN